MSEAEEIRRKFQTLSMKREWNKKKWNKQELTPLKNNNIIDNKDDVWVIDENPDLNFTSPAKNISTQLLQQIYQEKQQHSRKFIHDEAEVSGEDTEDEEEISEDEEENSFIDDEEEELESERSCISEDSFNESFEDNSSNKSKNENENSIIEISSDEDEEIEQNENIMKYNRPTELLSVPNSRLSTQVFYDSPIKNTNVEKSINSHPNHSFQKNRDSLLKHYYMEFNQTIFKNQLPRVIFFFIFNHQRIHL